MATLEELELNGFTTIGNIYVDGSYLTEETTPQCDSITGEELIYDENAFGALSGGTTSTVYPADGSALFITNLSVGSNIILNARDNGSVYDLYISGINSGYIYALSREAGTYTPDSDGTLNVYIEGVTFSSGGYHGFGATTDANFVGDYAITIKNTSMQFLALAAGSGNGVDNGDAGNHRFAAVDGNITFTLDNVTVSSVAGVTRGQVGSEDNHVKITGTITNSLFGNSFHVIHMGVDSSGQSFNSYADLDITVTGSSFSGAFMMLPNQSSASRNDRGELTLHGDITLKMTDSTVNGLVVGTGRNGTGWQRVGWVDGDITFELTGSTTGLTFVTKGGVGTSEHQCTVTGTIGGGSIAGDFVAYELRGDKKDTIYADTTISVTNSSIGNFTFLTSINSAGSTSAVSDKLYGAQILNLAGARAGNLLSAAGDQTATDFSVVFKSNEQQSVVGDISRWNTMTVEAGANVHAGSIALLGENSVLNIATGSTLTASGISDVGTINVTGDLVEGNNVIVSGLTISELEEGTRVMVGDTEYEYGIFDGGYSITSKGNLVIYHGDNFFVEPEAPSLVYVNSEFADYTEGSVIEIAGSTAVIGIDAFATLDAGVAGVAEDGTVEVIGGMVSFTNSYDVNIVVDAGATVVGTAVFNRPITINGTIVFDTGYTNMGMTAQYQGLSFVSGAMNYTLNDYSGTVGAYVLATDAASFNSTVSFYGMALTLGETCVIEGKTYTLGLTDNNDLILTINDYIPPPALDVTAPVLQGLYADVTGSTAGCVTVQAFFTDDTGVDYILYRVGDDGSWQNYYGGVTVFENTVIYFKAYDAAGNVSTASYEVTNLEPINPGGEFLATPVFSVSTTYPTNGAVVVTAIFDANAASNEYSFDGSIWQPYSDPITFMANGAVYFRSVGANGNMSEISTCVVRNIDTVAPEKPTVTASITELTNGNVTLTAVFSDDCVTKEYSLDGVIWTDYTDAVTVTTNGVVLFRSVDAAGNMSEIAQYTVSNIDKEAPVITLAGDNASPAQSAVLTASTEAGATLYYSTDNITWKQYVSAISVTENGTYYFKATDAAGNVGINSIAFENIVTAPSTPVVSVSTTDPTNGDVVVSATFSANAETKEYSFDGTTWQAYTEAITFTDNGTVYFRSADADGNMSEVAGCTVGNIDKIAPEAPVATPTELEPTNKNLFVMAKFSDDSVERQYSQNGGAWTNYRAGVKFTENGTISFRGIDAAGNISEVTTYTVDNIDKDAPVAPTASPSITDPTGGDVIVTGVFSEDSAVKEYSLDGRTWQTYSQPITFTANGTVYFRAADEVGNVSDITSYSVNNIDKIAPDAPTAVANITGPTNQDVIVTGVFSADSTVREYSLDGKTWQAYSDAITFTDNGTVYFRAADAAGNMSGVTSYTVDCINRVAPVITLTGDNVTPLQASTVSAVSDSDLPIYYSTDNQSWNLYVSEIAVTANGVYYFKITDDAGNTGTAQIRFDNIDTVAPEKPVAVPSITADTNQPVEVTATFSADSVVKEYSTDGANWQDYTQPLTFTQNAVVYFRGVDAAGNVSEVTTCTVDNIDTVAPVAPTASPDVTGPTSGNVVVAGVFSADSAVKEYSLDGKTWQAYSKAITFTENGTVHFRAADAVGNVSEVTTYTVDCIDREAPAAPTAAPNISSPTNQDVIVAGVFSADSAVKEYSLDGKTWQTYTDAITFTENGIVYFRAADAAGNMSEVTSYTVDYIDREMPDDIIVTPDITALTNQDVHLTAEFADECVTREYSVDNGKTWQPYTGPVTVTAISMVNFRGIDEAGNIVRVNYMVMNIDKTAPKEPKVTADITEPTSSNVTLTVEYSFDSTLGEYSLDDGKTWLTYYAPGVVYWTIPVTLTENGMVLFRGIDGAGNVSEITSYTVDYIDKVAPVAPTAFPSITGPTNQNVVVTGVFSEDSVVREYSVDNGTTWKTYAEPITFTDNGKVSFRAADAAGNMSDVTSYTVDYIDREAPEAPIVTPDITDLTNQDVHLSVEFSEDSVVREYSVDNGKTWKPYTEPVAVTAISMVNFRGTDAAGNSAQVNYMVMNIDKTPPKKPTVAADITELTNSDVTLTVEYSFDSTLGEYSLDGGKTWLTYDAPGVVYWTLAVTLTENGTVLFRGIDGAGNPSEVTSYTVNNIDKLPPEAPTASPNITAPTNQDVIVTGVFSEDSAVKEYSLDGKSWQAYSQPITFTDNGTVYFRAADALGNMSEVTSYTVDCIDRIAPVITLTGDTETPLQASTISAVSDGGMPIYYSTDEQTWIPYESEIAVTGNGVYYFKTTDEAGNTGTAQIQFDNIDTVAPDAPVAVRSITESTNQPVEVAATFSDDSVVKEYSTDGANWKEYTQPLTFTQNAVVSFRGVDAAGNVSEVTTCTVDNIDKTAPVIESAVLAQSGTGYLFTAAVTASDDRTAADALTYCVRYAENAEDLATAGTIDGLNFELTPAEAGRTLYYQVGVKDAAGNTTWTTAKPFTVNDLTAPELNGQPNATFAERTVTVAWEEATDNIGVAGYRLTLNGTVYDLREPGYVLESVEAGSYMYQVVAYDEAGNETASEQKTLEVAPRADLYINSVRITKDNKPATTISIMSEAMLLFEIGNKGDVASTASALQIYCGDVLMKTISVASIAAKASPEVSVFKIEAGTMSSGIQELRLVLDANNSVPEYSEANNEMLLNLNVENDMLSDLVIGTINLDKAVYSTDEKATLSFTVRNIGYVSAASSRAYIYNGDTVLGSVDVGSIEVGDETETLQFAIDVSPLAAGSHAIRVVADGNNAISENNRGNNSAQIQLTVGAPDLRISKLSLSKDGVNTDEDVKINFTVRNGGDDKAGASVVGIYDGDRLLGTVAIDELASGLSVSNQFVVAAGKLAPGQHSLRVVADSGSAVTESDETNNARSVNLLVSQKDDEAPTFDNASIAALQDADGYGIVVSAAAVDNFTPAADLVYGIRYAATAEALETAETLSGTAFELTPEDAGRTLYYQVSATDLAGNTAWSEVKSFVVADHTAPEIGAVLVSTENSSLSLKWDAADNVGVSFYNVYFDDEFVSTVETGAFTKSDVATGSHTFRIEAVDAAGNMKSTRTMNVNFDDSEAPVILSVQAFQGEGYGVGIEVSASDNETAESDLSVFVQYAMSVEDILTAPLGGLNITLTPEDAGKTLYYMVSVSDEAGNTSRSNIQTLAVADRTAPDAPAELAGTVNGSGVVLNWTASVDNVGVTGYLVRYGTSQTLTGNGVSVQTNELALSSLKEGVYYWQTAAFDAAGNISGWSEVKSFRIMPEDKLDSAPGESFALGVLAAEQTLTGGSIVSANDEDWFSFTIDTKGKANDFVQLAYDSAIGDLEFSLYAGNGTTLLSTAETVSDGVRRISLKDLAKGSYLLKVSGRNGGMSTFSISTKKVAGYDMDRYDANARNDSPEAATVFDIEKTPQASITGLNIHEVGDVDYYQFKLSNMGLKGDSVSIGFENSVGDLDLRLIDAKGNVVAESAGTRNVETISFNGVAAGTYYLEVKAAYNAVNEYTMDWSFTSNKVEADWLETQEPYAITGSVDLAGLSISAAGAGVTQEDTFHLTLAQNGSAASKIRFSNYRSDWSGLKYVVKDADGIVLSGIGSEISLDGLDAGEYTLTVDTPVASSYSAYDISVSLPESATTKWTYMVYMASDNNLDPYALYDIIAMQQADLDSQIDIYVLVDRGGATDDQLAPGTIKWDSDWTDTRVGKISYSPGNAVTVEWESWGELDTSSIATLDRFITWSQDQSGAENYALVMWDHGTEDGSLCVDATTDESWSSSLAISEVSELLAQKDNIPLVVFNNCLLGSELVVTQMVGSTDVIVVSESESYPSGTTYGYKKFFSTITADMTAGEMAEVLIQNVQQYGDGTVTSMLSAVDVTDDRLSIALEALANSVLTGGNSTDRSVLVSGMMKTLQNGCAYPGSVVYQSDLYDVIVQTMADKRYSETSEQFKTALANLQSTLEDVVLCSKTVPANRGYGIAVFNPVITARIYAAGGYTTRQAANVIRTYLNTYYTSTPAWSALLGSLATTYQTLNIDAKTKVASFGVSSKFDNQKSVVVSAIDIGCFSGHGVVLDGISVFNEQFLGIAITAEDKSTGSFRAIGSNGEDVTITLISEDDEAVAEGVNYVSFAKAPVGDCRILLQTDTECNVTLSFEADWTTGVDRFDYAQSQINEANVNGNGSISKATSMNPGYYSGLLTYQGDSDWYLVGNIYADKYRIELDGAEGMTVAEYDTDGKLVQTAKFADGVYTMTMRSMNYLLVEGSADITQNLVDAYSVNITAIANGEVEDTEPPVITLSGDNQTPLRASTLTAETDDGSAIFYSLDGETWVPYEDTITVTANATYYFKATDVAGNEGTAEYVFANIDTVAPEAPVVVADVTEFTSGSVTVTATFSGDSVKKEYTLDGGETWQDYPAEGVVIIIINGTVGFRGTDAAGNVSEVAKYEVTNIDKTAPGAPSGLVAEVSDQTVTLSWAAGTDDLSGVKSYIVTYSHDGQEFTANTTDTTFVIEKADAATWQWSVQTVDAAGNISELANGEAFTVEQAVAVPYVAKSDIDGNGISDVMFVWTGNNYQHGYWMNGTSEWQSQNGGHPTEWDNLGCHDMTGDGKADSVLVGNVVVNEVKGAYIGYYADAIDNPDGSTWMNIGYLNNADDIGWKNIVGNLTGGEANSIVWYAPELYALGVWTDGTDAWVTLSNSFGGDDWTLVGCGDFDGDGKESVVMSGANGTYFYTADIDGAVTSMGAANWSGWEVRAIGDFAADGKDDLVLFHPEYGSMVMLADGNLDSFASIGQLDAADWFVVGAGDYNGDQHDDLLVRQYSTGMLGYYVSGDTSQWVELGRGVDMQWTVIA